MKPKIGPGHWFSGSDGWRCEFCEVNPYSPDAAQPCPGNPDH